MRSAVLLLAMASLGVADRPAEKRATPEQDLLQGTWKLVRVQGFIGEDMGNGRFVTKLRIVNDRFIFNESGFISKGSIRLSASHGIKKIDLEVKRPRDFKRTMRGIYRIQGNKMTMCLNLSDGPRPNKFKAKDYKVVYFWQRERK